VVLGYTPGLSDAHIDLREGNPPPTQDPRPAAGAGPLAFVGVAVVTDTPDPPSTNRYLLKLPGNARPAARCICRDLPDSVVLGYTPGLSDAHIDLREGNPPPTQDPRPAAGAGPLAFVGVAVVTDAPDPPRPNRYMLKMPGNERPAARSISRALPDSVVRAYTPGLSVAHIDLCEATRDQRQRAGATRDQRQRAGCKLVLATLVRAIAFRSHIGLHHRLHLCSSRGQCNEQQDKCSEVSTALMAA